jgi:hypothetical protein
MGGFMASIVLGWMMMLILCRSFPDVVSSKTLTAGSGRIGVATALTQVAMESVPPDPSGQFVADKM